MQSKSSRELRRFGLTVGGIFTLLAALSWWRGHVTPPAIMGTLGVLLIVPGLVYPRMLGPVERTWMRFATVLGHVNSRIILTLVYYLVLTPIGLVMGLFRDPLNRRLGDGRTTDWIRREGEPVSLERYRQQF